jgi:hypothetical protein
VPLIFFRLTVFTAEIMEEVVLVAIVEFHFDSGFERFEKAMQPKVKSPWTISIRVCTPITRLAKVRAYSCVRPATPAE